jgi:hypothetical protein
MDMRDEWLRGLRAWANGNGNVSELWLFGSRADGSSRPESDVDIAIALMPAVGKTDWARLDCGHDECRDQRKSAIQCFWPGFEASSGGTRLTQTQKIPCTKG